MTIEIVLTEEQSQQIPGDGDDLIVVVRPDGQHVGRVGREFSAQDRRTVEEIVERRRTRDPNAKSYTLEEIFEKHRALQAVER